MNTFSSRRFNQDSSGAKRAAAAGPVYITERGRTSHVLMTVEEFRRLKSLAGEASKPPAERSIVDLLAMEEAGDVEFDPPRSRELPRLVDLD